MIEQIEISAFKRFGNLPLEIAPLTVLAGLNGSGKSSVIQALLIARLAAQRGDGIVPLSGGPGLEVGTAGEALNWRCKAPIAVTIKSSDAPLAVWQFDVPADDALYLKTIASPTELPSALAASPRAFTYLSADRLGPRRFSAASALPDEQLEIGVQGEHLAHVLSVLGDKILDHPERSHPSDSGGKPRLLKYEVETWLSEITRPVEITGQRISGSSFAELTYRFPGDDWVRAPNMGFGISYSLPIILGGLIARRGGLFIVENPEAHLHPAGQSRIGLFLAWLAGKGVQVLVETHSDHVVNGIRRAIAEFGYLAAESSIAQFFPQGGEDTEPDRRYTEALRFTNVGTITDWPQGFFDQYQIDVASLGRIRRRR